MDAPPGPLTAHPHDGAVRSAMVLESGPTAIRDAPFELALIFWPIIWAEARRLGLSSFCLALIHVEYENHVMPNVTDVFKVHICAQGNCKTDFWRLGS